MRVAGIKPTSIHDGVGINFVIFTQGCPHHCQGCHNPSTWNAEGGQWYTLKALQNIIESYDGFITGVTFSGGDPMIQVEEVIELSRWCKSKHLQTTMYTGYTMEYIVKNNPHVLDNMDYVIDGRFEQELQSRDCPFRGSLNQRLWHKVNNRWETEM